jgi:hypothetical protein
MNRMPPSGEAAFGKPGADVPGRDLPTGPGWHRRSAVFRVARPGGSVREDAAIRIAGVLV